MFSRDNAGLAESIGTGYSLVRMRLRYGHGSVQVRLQHGTVTVRYGYSTVTVIITFLEYFLAINSDSLSQDPSELGSFLE